jgi:D-alanyl-D-alanine carboxypeptidase
MLIVSANDAARALAIDVAGSEAAFVERMNAAAASLGLDATVAANVVGLDAPGAGSTARDVTVLAATLLRDQTFRETVARRTATLHGTTFAATNKMLGSYAGADGVKTGRTTQAGFCVVASATRDGRQVIVAVLGSTSDEGRFAAATALLDWAFAT